METAKKQPCIYILASERNGTLYTGVTSDIARRAWLHRSAAVDGFTKRYAVHRLVYAEFHQTMPDATVREKQIKKWRRAWKLELIEKTNPQWLDLYDHIQS
ncbi:MAG: GIY-YIG nuclease family protein [Gallionella sp.]